MKDVQILVRLTSLKLIILFLLRKKMFLKCNLHPIRQLGIFTDAVSVRITASSFQRNIDSLFREMEFIGTFSDDLLIFSKNKDLHDKPEDKRK